MGGPLAVVDVGSNSLRLLLADAVGPSGASGPRSTTIVGLRRGASPTGELAADALDRLDAALIEVADRISDAGARDVVAVATSAVREAPNASAVVDAVRRRLGVPLQVVPGETEALLSFAGARAGVPGAPRCAVVDIGGGSTELVRGGETGVEWAVSLRLGAVRHTEGFLYGDPPETEELAALRADAAHELGAAGWGPLSAPLVGVAGTITTLAAIELGVYDPERVHGHLLTAAGVAALVDRLAGMTVAERRGVPGLEPARAPVIVAGACILAEVMSAARAPEITVSERDLLDGVALAAAGGVPGAEIARTTRPR